MSMNNSIPNLLAECYRAIRPKDHDVQTLLDCPNATSVLQGIRRLLTDYRAAFANHVIERSKHNLETIWKLESYHHIFRVAHWRTIHRADRRELGKTGADMEVGKRFEAWTGFMLPKEMLPFDIFDVESMYQYIVKMQTGPQVLCDKAFAEVKSAYADFYPTEDNPPRTLKEYCTCALTR